MPKAYDITVKVLEVKGNCYIGHRIGDEWVVKGIGATTPGGICFQAFCTMELHISAMRCGGVWGWQTDPNTDRLRCPDPDNRVVFELRRQYQ